MADPNNNFVASNPGFQAWAAGADQHLEFSSGRQDWIENGGRSVSLYERPDAFEVMAYDLSDESPSTPVSAWLNDVLTNNASGDEGDVEWGQGW